MLETTSLVFEPYGSRSHGPGARALRLVFLGRGAWPSSSESDNPGVAICIVIIVIGGALLERQQLHTS